MHACSQHLIPRSLLPAPCSLLLGGLICVSIYPLALLAINRLWYRGNVTGLVRTQPADLAGDWAQATITGKRETKNLGLPELEPPLPAWKMIERYATGHVQRFFGDLSAAARLRARQEAGAGSVEQGVSGPSSLLPRPDTSAFSLPCVAWISDLAGDMDPSLLVARGGFEILFSGCHAHRSGGQRRSRRLLHRLCQLARRSQAIVSKLGVFRRRRFGLVCIGLLSERFVPLAVIVVVQMLDRLSAATIAPAPRPWKSGRGSVDHYGPRGADIWSGRS